MLTDERRLGEREVHDFFAGNGTDIVVQAQHFDAGDILDHFFHERPRRFDEMGPDLLEEVFALFGRQRLDQMPFRRSQYSLQADDEQIADHVRVHVFGAAAHVLLLKATDPVADGGFDFTLSLHGVLGLQSR
jgi:hypothetical protein